MVLRDELKHLKGLGPKSQDMLNAIGIHNPEQFKQADPFELYQALKRSGQGVGLNMLYAMIGAQQNIHWAEVKNAQRLEILLRLEEMDLLS